MYPLSETSTVVQMDKARATDIDIHDLECCQELIAIGLTKIL